MIDWIVYKNTCYLRYLTNKIQHNSLCGFTHFRNQLNIKTLVRIT